jgi:hypothetical protein
MDEILERTCLLVLGGHYASRIRKLEPWNGDSWNVYLWRDGWQFFDNVGKETAAELVSDAAEIFREISLPQHG